VRDRCATGQPLIATLVAILNEGEAGMPGSRGGPQARDQRREILQLEMEYAGVAVSELKRMRELKPENAKLEGRATKLTCRDEPRSACRRVSCTTIRWEDDYRRDPAFAKIRAKLLKAPRLE
jgi:hypothetical protein